MGTTAIVWLRSDLRVHDHPALTAAAAVHERVVPLFVTGKLTPDSIIAIVRASSSRFRETNPPFSIRSRTACSGGVGCSSGSRPMCR